jgi:hypothetical protein
MVSSMIIHCPGVTRPPYISMISSVCRWLWLASSTSMTVSVVLIMSLTTGNANGASFSTHVILGCALASSCT